MKLTEQIKDKLKNEIRESLRQEKEIDKIVVFGSFLKNNEINDIDIAIFQHSNKPYLPLALKYRRLTRTISKRIPLDILPVISHSDNSTFLQEIETGELIYER